MNLKFAIWAGIPKTNVDAAHHRRPRQQFQAASMGAKTITDGLKYPILDRNVQGRT